MIGFAILRPWHGVLMAAAFNTLDAQSIGLRKDAADPPNLATDLVHSNIAVGSIDFNGCGDDSIRDRVTSENL